MRRFWGCGTENGPSERHERLLSACRTKHHVSSVQIKRDQCQNEEINIQKLTRSHES